MRYVNKNSPESKNHKQKFYMCNWNFMDLKSLILRLKLIWLFNFKVCFEAVKYLFILAFANISTV